MNSPKNETAMKHFDFSFSYYTRNVVITGNASVIGDYDGPSKPEAMVRSALAEQEAGNLCLTWMNEPAEDSTETCKHGTLKNYMCALCQTPVPGPPNPPKGKHPAEFG